jgi:hypothetical protein
MQIDVGTESFAQAKVRRMSPFRFIDDMRKSGIQALCKAAARRPPEG